MTTVRGALWLHAEMVRTRPAKAGGSATCRCCGSTVASPRCARTSSRLQRAFQDRRSRLSRAVYDWALRIAGRLNVSVCPLDWIPFLIRHSGLSTGIGDWRNEKNGMFGAYHLGNPKENEEWDKFAAGTGELPVPVPFGDDGDVHLGFAA